MFDAQDCVSIWRRDIIGAQYVTPVVGADYVSREDHKSVGPLALLYFDYAVISLSV